MHEVKSAKHSGNLGGVILGEGWGVDEEVLATMGSTTHIVTLVPWLANCVRLLRDMG
jgi:hypothetical protein